jgi:uncharacterized membrane protein YkoI
MKKLYLILNIVGISALTGNTFAKEEKYITAQEAPGVVREAFQQAYTQAQNIKYEADKRDGKLVYEVEFNLRGKKWEAAYTPDGRLIETEEDIAVSELPPVVAQAVKAAYAHAKIEEVERVMNSDGTLTAYEIEIEDGKNELILLMDPNGKILKTEGENAEVVSD